MTFKAALSQIQAFQKISRQNHHQFRKRIGFSVSLTTTAGWPVRNTKKEKTNSHDDKARPIIITYTTHCIKSFVA